MQYTNPIIYADFSDPDVIRVGDDYFMVSSSFNFVPGVPVLHSKNLVEWHIIGHVLEEIPFERFNKVCHGDGAWAVSLRYHDGFFYCVIPFPDEGIYVSRTKNPFGKWSKLECLIKAKGYIDPCPIWADDKCYLTFAFAKSRIGFNSKIAVIEVSTDLKKVLSKNYTIVYNGEKVNPTIEGPKFYYERGYFYILAPAGGVKNGWQVALRSKSVYGPYESKLVLYQGDTKINGPHQGALVSTVENDWFFVHFQDKGAYGRITHLQPVSWICDWPIIGKVNAKLNVGTPVDCFSYPVNIQTKYKIQTTFEKDNGFEYLQTPANKNPAFYAYDSGLRLNCVKFTGKFCDMPQLFTQRLAFENFTASAKCTLKISGDDRVGFGMLGNSYAFLSVKKANDRYLCSLYQGERNTSENLIEEVELFGEEIHFSLSARIGDDNELYFVFSVNGVKLKSRFRATAGRWVGARIAIFASSSSLSRGYATFECFNQTRNN